MGDNFIYYGLFLTKESRTKLQQYISAHGYRELIEALSSKWYLDHCTLLHKSQLINSDAFILKSKLDTKLNTKLSIRIDGIGMSEKAFAFRVKGVNEICFNSSPHITISTRKGGQPVDSNYIKYWKPIEFISVNVELRKI